MTPRLELTRYRLPLHQPWRTAQGVLHERQGWLVRASWQGCCGYGDCAPLPEAGTETPQVAAARLSSWARGQAQADLETQLALLARGCPSATPAADAALETALLDLSARLASQTLRDYLVSGLQPAESVLPEPHPKPAPKSRSARAMESDQTPKRDSARASDANQTPKPESGRASDSGQEPEPRQGPARRPRPEIEVNAALGALTAQQPNELDRALAAGFRVLKVKVGVAPILRELEAIRALCEQLPAAVRLRLDANRAWSLATARKLLDGLLPVASQIECLEEPCASANDAELRALQAQVPFALALDESLPARGWPLAPEQLPLRRLVLKAGVIGGLRSSLQLAQRAQAAGLEVVITSLIESAAGLWSSTQLAAATGSSLAHGLATADWLAADLGAAPVIQAGRIRLPASPGSGFVPADACASAIRQGDS